MVTNYLVGVALTNVAINPLDTCGLLTLSIQQVIISLTIILLLFYYRSVSFQLHNYMSIYFWFDYIFLRQTDRQTECFICNKNYKHDD